jgi:Ca2+-binding EF-hand superfamily protein
MEMSSVSMSGGVSATLFSSLQKSQATDRSQKLFDKLDTNGDGSIDSTELKTFADNIGSKTGTQIDSSSLMKALDTDGDGSVSATELKDNGKALFDNLRQQLAGSQSQAPAGASAGKPYADKLFNSIDTDGNGSISKDELDSFLSKQTDATTSTGSPSATDLMARLDTDGNGSISASELKAGMHHHGPHGPPPGGAPLAGASDDSGSSTSSDSSDTSSDYISKLVASLIAQYGASKSDAATTGSTLSVAA